MKPWDFKLLMNGQTLFAAWTTSANELVWSSSELGQNWRTPELAAVDVLSGAIASDPSGRLLITYDRRGGSSVGDVFFKWRNENGDLMSEVNVTPPNDNIDQANPRTMAVDPAGLPVILYQTTEPGVDPVSVDVWQAKF